MFTKTHVVLHPQVAMIIYSQWFLFRLVDCDYLYDTVCPNWVLVEWVLLEIENDSPKTPHLFYPPLKTISVVQA